MEISAKICKIQSVKKIIFFTGVIFYFFIIISIFTYPLIFKIQKEIPNPWNLDTLVDFYRMNHVFKNLFHFPSMKFFDANILYPYEGTLAFIDTLFTQCLFTAPFYFITENLILTHNIIIILSLFLTAMAVFMVTKELTENALAGLVAGTAVSFFPILLNEMAFINVVSFEFIPWILFFLIKFRKTSKAYYLYIIAILTFLQFFASIQWFLFLLIFVIPFIVFFIFPALRKYPKKIIVHSCLCLILAFILIFFCGRFHLQNKEKHNFHNSISDISTHSLSPSDYIKSSEKSPLSRYFTKKGYTPAYSGIVILILSLCSLIFIKMTKEKWLLIYIFSFFIISFLMSLNPHIIIYDKKLPTLSYILPKYIPLFQSVRSWLRFSIPSEIFLCISAGFGISSILSFISKKSLKFIITSIFIFLISIDNFSAPISTGKPVLSFDKPQWAFYLEKNFPSKVVFHYPVAFISRELLRYQTFEAQFYSNKTLNGLNGLNPYLTMFLWSILQNFPDSETISILKSLAVEVVAIHNRHTQWKKKITPLIKNFNELKFSNSVEDVDFYVIEKGEKNIFNIDMLKGFNCKFINDFSYSSRGKIWAGINCFIEKDIIVNPFKYYRVKLKIGNSSQKQRLRIPPVLKKGINYIALEICPPGEGSFDISIFYENFFLFAGNITFKDYPLSTEKEKTEGEIKVLKIEKNVRPGGMIPVVLRLKNTGKSMWISESSEFYPPRRGEIQIVYRFFKGNKVIFKDRIYFYRSLLAIPFDISPMKEIDVESYIQAPRTQGIYRLELEMDAEYVKWFNINLDVGEIEVNIYKN